MKENWLILSVTLLLAGCKLCDETTVTEVKSPDGRYIATNFERNCGPPARYVFHVNIRESTQESNADSEGRTVQGEVFRFKSGGVRLVWIDNGHLLIEHEEGRIYSLEKSWNGIEVT